MEMPLDFLCAMLILRDMVRKTPIDALIDAKLEELAALDNSREILQIELNALMSARAAITGEVTLEEVTSGASSVRRGSSADSEKKRGRSLSDNWKQVLAAIGEKGPEGADLDQIFRFCGEHGIELQRPTLRAQMSGYVKRGYVSSNGNGRFFIAHLGACMVNQAKADAQINGHSKGKKEIGTPALTGVPSKG
jgi:hypothetical protein